VNEQDKDVGALHEAIEIKEEQIQAHLGEMVRTTVGEALSCAPGRRGRPAVSGETL
jgi:hypothetical protein